MLPVDLARTDSAPFGVSGAVGLENCRGVPPNHGSVVGGAAGPRARLRPMSSAPDSPVGGRGGRALWGVAPLNLDAAHLREAHFGSLDASRYDAENSVEELRSQRGVAHTVGLEGGPINLQGVGLFACPNLEQGVLIVQQGTPPKHIPRPQGLHGHDVLPPAQLHHYTAGQQQEEGCRAFPLKEDDFVLLKRDLVRDSGQTVDLCLGEPMGEGVISENLFLWHIPQLLCENPQPSTANPFRVLKYPALWHEKGNSRATC